MRLKVRSRLDALLRGGSRDAPVRIYSYTLSHILSSLSLSPDTHTLSTLYTEYTC